MSTAQTDRPTTDRPTATYPTSQWLAEEAVQPERSPFAGWRGQAPTELLPTVPGPAAFPRVSTLPEPTDGREALDSARGPRQPRTKGPGRRERAERAERRREARRRHLRRALAAIALAAALLTGLQLYAASGITSARQAALQSARESAGARAYSTPSDAAPSRPEQAAPEHGGGQQSPMSGQTPAPATMSDRTSAAPMSGQTDTRSEWITQDTGAAYDRTDPSASPLSLPRCTTSPDTPLPCLATISPDSRRAVVLEEDASLTALVRR